MHGENLKLIGG